MSFLSRLFGRNQDPEPAQQPHPKLPPPPMLARGGIHPPGTRIAGRYEVAGTPLMGAFGVVYLCNDLQDDRAVALKTFRPEFLPDRAARDRFLREGTAWVELGAHAHIVRCFGVFQTDNALETYLVLELVAKEENRADASLRSWLVAGRPLPLETALLFALQIARGMAHAVERIPGFVHRDLKPENVLVGADKLPGWSVNRLRVTDFGLASVLEVSSQADGTREKRKAMSATQHLESGRLLSPSRTQLTHGITGTPLYMAPEQWRGEPLGVQTDVYALGCVLYEMLSGQRAVAGGSLSALEHAHCAGEIQPLPATVPAPVCEVLARCLTPPQAERYDTWDAVEADIAAALESTADSSTPKSPVTAALSREERIATGWSFGVLGASYLSIGKAEVALSYFERALRIGRAESDRTLEGAALGNLGIAYKELGDPRRATGLHERSLAIAREIGDRCGEGGALSGLGTAYRNLGDPHGAVLYHEQALAITRETGDRSGEGKVLCSLGLAYKDLGDPYRAIGYYEQALVIARETYSQQDAAGILGNLGVACKNLGNTRLAIKYHEQALTLAREIGDRAMEGAALGNLGVCHNRLGNAPGAVEFFEQALVIAREVGDRRGEATLLGNVGVSQLILREVNSAADYHKQHLERSREIGDRDGENRALANLNTVFDHLLDQANTDFVAGNARGAVEGFELALGIARETHDQRKEGRILGNLGSAYGALGDPRRAVTYYQQALVIQRATSDHHAEGNSLMGLGSAYTDLSEAKHALKCYEQALTIFRRIGALNSVAACGYAAAVVYGQQGESARALSLAQEAARIWVQLGSRNAALAHQLGLRLLGKSR